MKIYVGNLPWSVTSDGLAELFGTVGAVTSATVIADRDTGRSRGFGFVEMDDAAGREAISTLNGHQLESRALRVNEANDNPRRSRSF